MIFDNQFRRRPAFINLSTKIFEMDLLPQEFYVYLKMVDELYFCENPTRKKLASILYPEMNSDGAVKKIDVIIKSLMQKGMLVKRSQSNEDGGRVGNRYLIMEPDRWYKTSSQDSPK